jgi:hypothetical protein
MKSPIKALTILSAVALAASARAGVTEADGLGSSWIGSPTFMTVTSPTLGTSAEGNYGSGGSGSRGGLAQSFVNTTAGTLNNIQLSVGGTAGAGFNIFLYDLGSASGYTPATSATFSPGSLTDLLSAGAGFSYAGGGGGAQSVLQLSFSGADAVSLSANEVYGFTIEPTTAAAMTWYRGGATAFTGGQAYRLGQFSAGNYGAINGGIREFDFALTVTPVPEPATMALVGFSALVGSCILRRRKN